MQPLFYSEEQYNEYMDDLWFDRYGITCDQQAYIDEANELTRIENAYYDYQLAQWENGRRAWQVLIDIMSYCAGIAPTQPDFSNIRVRWYNAHPVTKWDDIPF